LASAAASLLICPISTKVSKTWKHAHHSL
jgi:hypothetical protein